MRENEARVAFPSLLGVLLLRVDIFPSQRRERSRYRVARPAIRRPTAGEIRGRESIEKREQKEKERGG